jgi:hypothetical protein
MPQSYRQLLTRLHGKAKELLESDLSFLENPSVVFSTIERTKSTLAHSARLQKVALQFRVAEKLFKKHGGDKSELPCLFAFSVTTPWDMAAVQNTVLSHAWFLDDPFTAHDPTTDTCTYIVCAVVKEGDLTKRGSVLQDKLSEKGSTNAEWSMAFGKSVRHLTPLHGSFSMAEQLATRFIQATSVAGEIVWVMGVEPKLNAHIALAAVALQRRPMLLVEEDDLEKMETLMSATVALTLFVDMWSDYKDPARVFTIVGLAKESTPDTESDPKSLRMVQIQPLDLVKKQVSALTYVAENYPDYELKASCYTTIDKKSIGLGVFTLKDFKKGDMAFKVFQTYFILDSS